MNNLYTRAGRMNDQANDSKPNTVETTEAQPQTQKNIQINGFQQIVDMLKVADPQFRASLLARLSKVDPGLVSSLRQALVKR